MNTENKTIQAGLEKAAVITDWMIDSKLGGTTSSGRGLRRVKKTRKEKGKGKDISPSLKLKLLSWRKRGKGKTGCDRDKDKVEMVE